VSVQTTPHFQSEMVFDLVERCVPYSSVVVLPRNGDIESKNGGMFDGDWWSEPGRTTVLTHTWGRTIL
jgi:hypothetical protein